MILGLPCFDLQRLFHNDNAKVVCLEPPTVRPYVSLIDPYFYAEWCNVETSSIYDGPVLNHFYDQGNGPVSAFVAGLNNVAGA